MTLQHAPAQTGTAPAIGDEYLRLYALRSQIEQTLSEMGDTLQRGIALLDALDATSTDLEPETDRGIDDDPHDPLDSGDADAELGWANDGSQARLHGDGSGTEREPTLGATGLSYGSNAYSWWRPTPNSTDECEEENEHGGDINDERQGPEDDTEPSLGATNAVNQEHAWRVGTSLLDAEDEHDGREPEGWH